MVIRGGVTAKSWKSESLLESLLESFGGSLLELRNDAFQLLVGAPEQAKQTGTHTVVVMVMVMVMVIQGGLRHGLRLTALTESFGGGYRGPKCSMTILP